MKLTEDYKYKSIRKTAEVLAELIDAAIPEDFGSSGGSSRSFDDEVVTNGVEVIVIPLPTISKHIRERGFDHMWLIAKELAKRRGWKAQKILSRINKTVQVGADEETRKKQAKGAYAVVGGRGFGKSAAPHTLLDSTKTYLLVDDVWTTGASMEAAIKIIKKAGAVRVASAVILMPPE